MPGFGTGPFGHTPFGHFQWSEAVLWDLIPEIYQQQDAQNGNVLHMFIEGVRPSFDNLLYKIENWLDLRDPLRVRTQYEEFTRLILGPRIVPYVTPDQRGSDGTIDLLSEFVSGLARFSESDVGKVLAISASKVVGNNQSVTVVSVIDAHTVLTLPQLLPDAGPLKWTLTPAQALSNTEFTVEVRAGDVEKIAPGWILTDGYAQFTVVERRQFAVNGTNAFRTAQEGQDGFIDGSNRFRSPTAVLNAQLIGRFLEVDGSTNPSNNGKFEITGIDMTTSPPSVSLTGFVSLDPGPLHWALLPAPQLDLEGQAILRGVVQQEGFDLQVTATSPNLYMPSGNFKSGNDPVGDVGKYVQIGNSVAGQNGLFPITGVVNANTIQVATPFATTESGLYWAVRESTATGDVEASGSDLFQVPPIQGGVTVLRSFDHDFNPSDVGLTITISDAIIPTNNGTFAISAVFDPNTIQIPFQMTGEPGPFLFQVHSGVNIKVQCSAPSMIVDLAPDFGITIDTQESEARQRSWVANVTQWIDLKGHESGYEILGEISGFTVTVLALYRITQELAESLPADHVYEVGESGVGRFGSDGTLVYDSVENRYGLFSPSAQFRPGDVERQIQITNAANPANNKLYTIDIYVSANQVDFRQADVGIAPDYGVGGTSALPTLKWEVVRLFTDLPPLAPLFDQLNGDQMTIYVQTNPDGDPELVGKQFHLDMWCWDPTFAAQVRCTVTTLTSLTATLWQVTVTGANVNVVLDPSAWNLQDANGTLFALETQPALVSGITYTFNVIASPTALPALGLGRLVYHCSFSENCGYCQASDVLVLLQEGAELAAEGGVAVEQAFDRVLLRLQEVVPAHVQLIPRFVQSIDCSLNISVTIDPDHEIYGVILVPKDGLFDLLPTDDNYPVRDLPGTFHVINGSPNVTASMSMDGILTPGRTIWFPQNTAPNFGPYTVQSVAGTAIVLTANYTGTTQTSTHAMGNQLFPAYLPLDKFIQVQITPDFHPPPPDALWVGDGGVSGYATEPDSRLTTIRVLDPATLALKQSIDISAYAAASPFATTIRMLRMASDGVHVLAVMHTTPPNYSYAFPWARGRVLFINKTTYAVEGIAELGLTSAGFQTINGARDCVDTGDGNLWVLSSSGGNTANELETFDIATVLANGPGTPTHSFQQLVIPNHAEEMCFDGTYIWTAPGAYSTTITRVDVSTNTAATWEGGRFFWGLTYLFGALWAGDDAKSNVWYRFDPGQFGTPGFITNTFTVPNALPAASNGVPVYDGFSSDGTSLWVSGAFSGSIPSGQYMAWWQVGQAGTPGSFVRPRDQYLNGNTNLVWVADQGSTDIVLVDALNGSFARTIDVSSVGWDGTRRIIGDLVYCYVGAASSATNPNVLAIISQSTFQIVGLCALPSGFLVRDITTDDGGVNLWVVGRDSATSTSSHVYKFSITSAISSYPTPASPTVTSPTARAYHVCCYDPVTNTVFAGTKDQGGGIEILAQLNATTLVDIATQNFTVPAQVDWFQFLLFADGSIWASTDQANIIRINPSSFPTTGTNIPLGEGQFSSALFYDVSNLTILVGDDSSGQTIARVSVSSNTEVSHFTVTPALGGTAWCSSAIYMRLSSPLVERILVTGMDGSPFTRSGVYSFTGAVGSETQINGLHSFQVYPIQAVLTDTSSDPNWFGNGSQSAGTYDPVNNRVWFVRWIATGSGPENVYPGIVSIDPSIPALDTVDFNGGGTGYWQGPRNILYVPG